MARVTATIDDLNEAVAAASASLAEVHKRAAAVSAAAHAEEHACVKRQRVDIAVQSVESDQHADSVILNKCIEKLGGNLCGNDCSVDKCKCNKSKHDALYDASSAIGAMFRLGICDTGVANRVPRLLPELQNAIRCFLKEVHHRCYNSVRYSCRALLDLVDVLAYLGAEAASAVPELILLMQLKPASYGAEYQQCRVSAANALGNVGQNAAPAVESLVKAILKEENNNQQGHDDEQKAATDAIRRLGAVGRPAVVMLVQELLSAKYRKSAAIALGQVGRIPEAQPIIPQLITLLERESQTERMTSQSERDWVCVVVSVFGQIGETAKPALPVLRRLSAMKGAPDVREAASKSLRKLMKPAC